MKVIKVYNVADASSGNQYVDRPECIHNSFDSCSTPVAIAYVGYGGAARDGCVNITGEAHNSADCSRIPPNDKNTVMNSHSTDLSGKPTGASENAARNERIILGMAKN